MDFTPNQPQPGFIHLPANELICDEDEVKQLTAETKVMKIVKGRRVYSWDAQSRRNEALDCAVYALAALRISQQRFGIDLEVLADAQEELAADTPELEHNKETKPKPPTGGWLNLGGDSWL